MFTDSNNQEKRNDNGNASDTANTGQKPRGLTYFPFIMHASGAENEEEIIEEIKKDGSISIWELIHRIKKRKNQKNPK